MLDLQTIGREFAFGKPSNRTANDSADRADESGRIICL